MNSTNKKKTSENKQIFPVLYTLVIGLLCSVILSNYMDGKLTTEKSEINIIILVPLLIIEIYVAIFLQIIIHEAGHLMFGLISGYRFSSFRVGSLMLIKKEGTIKLRRLSIAGTGGQSVCSLQFWRFYNQPCFLSSVCSSCNSRE